MKVNLGSVEVTDEVRKAMRKRRGRGGLATREEARRDLLDAVNERMQKILNDESDDTTVEN